MNRAARRTKKTADPKQQRWLCRPTGEREVEIHLPPQVFDQAQRLVDAVRTQQRHESEAGEELKRLLRPYFPLKFNPNTDHIALVREKAIQVLTA